MSFKLHRKLIRTVKGPIVKLSSKGGTNKRRIGRKGATTINKHGNYQLVDTRRSKKR